MRFFTGLLLILINAVTFGLAKPECVLFFYKNTPLPDDILYAYDWIVLDQDNEYINLINEKFYMKKRAKMIGYLSVGEIEPYREYFNGLKNYVIGKNPRWNSFIADIRNKNYREFLLNNVAKRIIDKGFEGFFLDTLDSYKLASDKKEWKEFQKAEIEFIKALRKKYPDKLIIVNRAFEIIDKIYRYIDAVVVESLFFTVGNRGNYVETDNDYRNAIFTILEKIKKYQIPIIVIDYVDPSEKELAETIVEEISKKGFIPYVSDKYLQRVGFSKCKLVPRKVVLLYDSKLYPIRQEADVHRFIQMPLEYIGLVPELYDVNEPLPEVYPQLGYLGIVTMDISNKNENLEKWLVKAKKEGIKLFFVNDLPFRYDSPYLKKFGIEIFTNKDKNPLNLKVVYKKKGDGFEAPLVIFYTETFLNIKKGKPFVIVKNSIGQKHIPFALTEWGGYAVDSTLLNYEGLWVYNPFEIFRKVFIKETFPIPDITTENGRRILTVHIDGDAFSGSSEVFPSKTTGEVIRDEILKTFKVPHTVSIIEAEVAPWGLYPRKSKKLEKIAKSIFALPNIEVASHSFSHPFTWQPQVRPPLEFEKYGLHLPVRGYKSDSIDLNREIIGSIEYINNLVKEFNKKLKVFLWTGECNPDERAIRLTYIAKVFNVNGGDTSITKQEPFLKNISPMGVNYGQYFQVYAPAQNENIYTNLWRSPLWGYLNTIQTFELTEVPFRLKPISIYYHFYSAQKTASLNALKKVYRYALSQKINPIYLSEYAKRVLEFRHTAVLKHGNGFIVKNDGDLKTLRIPKDFGYPNLKKSKGIVGFLEKGKDVYIHLDNSGVYYLELTKEKPKTFSLISSNGQVVSFKKRGDIYNLKLKSYVPLEIEVFSGNCKLKINGKILKRKRIIWKLEGKHAKIETICNN